jgi:hypothetical protein
VKVEGNVVDLEKNVTERSEVSEIDDHLGRPGGTAKLREPHPPEESRLDVEVPRQVEGVDRVQGALVEVGVSPDDLLLADPKAHGEPGKVDIDVHLANVVFQGHIGPDPPVDSTHSTHRMESTGPTAVHGLEARPRSEVVDRVVDDAIVSKKIGSLDDSRRVDQAEELSLVDPAVLVLEPKGVSLLYEGPLVEIRHAKDVLRLEIPRGRDRPVAQSRLGRDDAPEDPSCRQDDQRPASSPHQRQSRHRPLPTLSEGENAPRTESVPGP